MQGYTFSDDDAADTGGDFETLPDDTYKVIVTEAEDRVSKSGNPMFAVTLRVVDGDYAGRLIWDYITLSEKARGLFVSRMGALGVTPELLNDLEPADIAHVLVGRTAYVATKAETYNEKTSAKVKRYTSDAEAEEINAAALADPFAAEPF
jgi:hypothetical protein